MNITQGGKQEDSIRLGFETTQPEQVDDGLKTLLTRKGRPENTGTQTCYVCGTREFAIYEKDGGDQTLSTKMIRGVVWEKAKPERGGKKHNDQEVP